jgi:hypothetical protein
MKRLVQIADDVNDETQRELSLSDLSDQREIATAP